MEFKNTPIESLWTFCKHVTTWVAFVASLFFIWGGIVGLMSKQIGMGLILFLLGVSFMIFEKTLARSLREEEFSRKQESEEQENS